MQTIQLAQVPENVGYCKQCDNQENPASLKDVQEIISLSNIPNLLNLLDHYEEIDEEIIKCLNIDFRIYPHLLICIPKAFSKARLYKINKHY